MLDDGIRSVSPTEDTISALFYRDGLMSRKQLLV